MKPLRAETRDLAVPVSLDSTVGIGKIGGYIAKYNTESQVLYDIRVLADPEGKPLPFQELIAPGAFTRTLLENKDIPALYNHDQRSVLGRTSSGTLTLTEDAVGLAFSLELPDTGLGRDSRELVRRGDIVGCSFGFYSVIEEITIRDGLPALRTLIEVDIFETTPVCTFPAYSDSEVELRNRNLRQHGALAVGSFLANARRLQLLDVD